MNLSITKTLEDALQYVEKRVEELKLFKMDSCKPDLVKETSSSEGGMNKSPEGDIVCLCNRCMARRESREHEIISVSVDLLNLSESTVKILKGHGIYETTNILESASVLFDNVENEMAILEILSYAYRIRKSAVLRYVEILDDNKNNLLGDVLELKMHHLSNFILDHPDLCTPEILNQQNKTGQTPLMNCVFAGTTECFHKLLSYESLDVNKKSGSGDTAFTVSLVKKDIMMATELLKRLDIRTLFVPNTLGKYPIHMAIFFGMNEIANLIFDKMFFVEEVEEEAKAFLSSDHRNTLLKNCCQFGNQEIAIRLLNLSCETVPSNHDAVITLFYCIKYDMKEAAELILMNEKNSEKWIRGEAVVEENNVISALAKPLFVDLAISMAGKIDLTNPHLMFHFCHEMIMATSLQREDVLEWMVINYHIPTYFVMDPDLNTIYSYLAIYGKTEHFKTLYKREIGSPPNMLMMNKSDQNPLYLAIQHKHFEIATFILENLKSEDITKNESTMVLILQYQKMAMKNRSPKILLDLFEKTIRVIRDFGKKKRQKEQEELDKLLTEMGETQVSTPKSIPCVRSIVSEKPATPKKVVKKNPVPQKTKEMVKPIVPVKRNIEIIKSKVKAPEIEIKSMESVLEEKKTHDDLPMEMEKVEIREIDSQLECKNDFVWDCENTDLVYMVQLSKYIFEPLGIL